MKKIIIVTGIILAAIAANIQAQTMVTGGTDTVSVGSQMPYAVTPDANIEAMVTSGLLSPSQFDWRIVTGTGAAINTSQLSILYPDSILITWGNSPESAQISVAENTIKNGEVVCSGTTQTLEVVIVDLPTLDATFDTAACGVNDYEVPVDLTGFGPWEVNFDVEYTDLGGSTITDSQTATVGSIGDSDGTYDLPVSLTTIAGADAGEYTVSITSFVDRISSKALNNLNGTASANISIVAIPTPNTGAIRHIEN